MDKKFTLIMCVSMALVHPSMSIIIECKYDTWNYNILGTIYDCSVENYPRIVTHESAQITRINGEHKSPRSSDDVFGFQAVNKVIRYFPRDLEKFFKNIQAIYIGSSQLEQIHQSDLKPLINLTYFYLWSNNIQVIEDGLFDFNPHLQLIGLDENHIIHIHPNVFDHLHNLRFFWLKNAPCVQQNVHDSKKEVQKVIKMIKSQCISSEFLALDEQFKSLENASKIFDSESFNEKLEVFEQSFLNSKFVSFRPLNYKFEGLKVQRVENLVSRHVDVENRSQKLSLKNIFVTLGILINFLFL
ncbi:hypothetical protein ACKWTF_015118 [Chironomus riparius]